MRDLPDMGPTGDCVSHFMITGCYWIVETQVKNNLKVEEVQQNSQQPFLYCYGLK
jgi:hypothetical protein